VEKRVIIGSVKRLFFVCLDSLLLAACHSNRPDVGFVGTLSGPSSELGVSGRDGTRLYLEQHGKELLTCDDKADPAQVVRCLDQLADSGVVLVIGPMTSGLVDSAIAAATRRDVLLVSPTVSAERLSGRDDALVRVIGTNHDQADTLAGILKQDKIRHAVLFWEEKNGLYTKAAVDRIVGSSHPMATTSASYRSGPDLDFDSLISIHRDADAFVIAGSAMDAALLAKSVRRAGLGARLYGTQFTMGNDLLRVAGPDAEGMVVAAAAGFADSTPARKAFTEQFRSRYQRAPSFGAAFAWEAASVSKVAWSATSSSEAKRRILSQSVTAPLGDSLAIDRFGDTRRRAVAHVVRHGKFVLRR